MMQNILKLAGLLLFVSLLVASLAFTSMRANNLKCSEIDIEFSNSDLIQLSKEEIRGLVYSADNKIIGKELGNINLEKIEQSIYRNQAVKHVDVYTLVAKGEKGFKGVLGVKVYHRKPAVRIMSSQGNYYLDKIGNRIPISRNYAAEVKVATGSISETYAKEKLLPFMMYIQEDTFWNAQIEQVQVDQDGDIYLIPLVGDQIVELGKPENYEDKLRNLFAFYKQVLAKNKWDKYKMISVKYKDQVVAKRR